MRAVNAVVAATLVLLGSTSPAVPAQAATSKPAPIDVAGLPLGRPPAVDYLAGGELQHHGRTVANDLPADAVEPQILGAVDGRPVVTAFISAGPRSGQRFWTLGSTGHAEQLGGVYQSYDYAPRLVARTGHVWVQYTDRTSPRTIWEIDARTGREIAVYRHDRLPRGLAPADQALVDGWVERREVIPDTYARSRDRSLVAVTRSVSAAAGVFNSQVTVRRASDNDQVARFLFPVPQSGGVSRVVFEDRGHILVLTTVSFTRRRGAQDTIVRCSVLGGTCERATEIGGDQALGIVRPFFKPDRPAS